MPTDSHPPTTATHREAPLCCPGCGYNLTGVCTLDRPAGDCPECGRGFEHKALLIYRSRRAYQPNLVIGLLVWPIPLAIAWPFVSCCSISATVDVPGIGLLLSLLFLLAVCSFTGWQLAKRVVEGARVGRDDADVPAFYRHAFWPWVLFSLAHTLLTVVYFVGGCAAVLITLSF